MLQTKEITCPKCKTIQTEDIEDFIIDTGDMDLLSHCLVQFKICFL
ncbi:Uncharacterised protein [Lysinibacillus capsici]|uniref:Uncharacterized protein n=1 Tax=Lysinibacillus capsici TaxID=2115968 RepID=A0A2X1A983_9BACI|nr:Uncharacterised protein [Lysinibacillus capsici]